VKAVKILLIGMVVSLFLLTTSGYAQQAGQKIGYLNLEYVFNEYQKTKDLDKDFETKYNTYQETRNKKLDEVRELQGKLKIVKEEEKKKIEDEMEQKRTDLLQYDNQQQTDLKKQQADKTREILLEIEETVRTFSEKEGYSYVLNDKVLIYGNKANEVTTPILQLLNEKYTKK
jgi:outer membrane protein